MQQLLNQEYYQYNPFAVPVLLAGLMALLLAFAVLVGERPSLVTASLSLLFVGIAAWLVPMAAVLLSSTEQVALTWARVAMVGGALIPAASVQLALVVMREHRAHVRLLRIVWLLSIGLGMTALLTSWVVPRVERFFWGLYPQYAVPGVLLPLLFVATGTFIMYRFRYNLRLERSDTHRHRLQWLALAYGAGYLGGVDFLAAFGLPVYPFAYVPVVGFMLLALYTLRKYHLVDITPEFAANQILATMTDALLVLDGDGIIRVANGAARAMFPQYGRHLVGTPLWALVDEVTFPLTMQELMREGGFSNREIRHRVPGQEVRYLSFSASTMASGEGKPITVVCVIREVTRRHIAEEQLRSLNQDLEQRVADRTSQLEWAYRKLEAEVAERKHAMDRLRKSRDQLDAILRGVADGVAVQDVEGRLLYANDAAVTTLGFPNVLALLEAPPDDVLRRLRMIDEAGDPLPPDAFPGRQALAGKPATDMVIGLVPVGGGRPRWSKVKSTPIRDKWGQVQFVVNVFTDVTHLKRAQEALLDLATVDELTGLLNRREMNRILSEEVNRYYRYHHPLAFVMLDIDNFKSVNDSYGHQTGDEVLKWLALHIRNGVRSTDRVARYGGEEFALILTETTEEDGYTVAEALRNAIAITPFEYEYADGARLSLNITISMGVAGVPADAESEDMLIEAADRALYQAKDRGKNLVVRSSESVADALPVPEEPLQHLS
jgi:diguanylate cyclase (GGDEF)-like protein/PAS domain S-box-containing protein